MPINILPTEIHSMHMQSLCVDHKLFAKPVRKKSMQMRSRSPITVMSHHDALSQYGVEPRGHPK